MEGGKSAEDMSKDELVEMIYSQRIKNQHAFREKLKQRQEIEELTRQLQLKESEHDEQCSEIDFLNFLLRDKTVVVEKKAESQYSLTDVLRNIINRKWAIKSVGQGKYLNCQGEGKHRRVEASKEQPDKTSIFTIVPLLTIMAHKNWRYACAEKDCQEPVQANREWNYLWETFWPHLEEDGSQFFPMRATNWRQPWLGDYVKSQNDPKRHTIQYAKIGTRKFEFIDMTQELPWSEEELKLYHQKRICKPVGRVRPPSR